jgi:hypothetical protein
VLRVSSHPCQSLVTSLALINHGLVALPTSAFVCWYRGLVDLCWRSMSRLGLARSEPTLVILCRERASLGGARDGLVRHLATQCEFCEAHVGLHLSNGLLAAGQCALDCGGHVSVSDRLVTNDGHERREHEHDEADRHRRANSGKHYGKYEQRCGPG